MSNIRALVLACGVLAATEAGADALKLRASCAGESGLCFTSLAAVLEELHVPTGGRSLPGPTNPVVVDIGPGSFDLTATTFPYCEGLSHVTFRGAGKNATELTGGGFPNQPGFFDVFGPYAVLILDCSKLEFAHLAIRTKPAVTNSAIRFVGEGSTYWTDVEIEAEDNLNAYPVPWLDSGALSADASHHYWYGVEMEVRGRQASGLWVTGSRHEIRASAIEIESEGGIVYGAIFGSGQFDVSVQGSTLSIEDAGPNLGHLAVVYLTNAAGFYPPCSQARFSIEGSRIIGETTAASGIVQGIKNVCANFVGKVSARGTQFDLAGPTRHRLFGSGFEAPYSLGSGASPPVVGSSWAPKGHDTFVETDCSASLCNDSSQGALSHTLSYDAACATAGPWFDQVTQRCRGL